MNTLPRALERYRGLIIAGQVTYPDHVVDIRDDVVDARFVENLGSLIRHLASQMVARRAPSPGEWRFCEITPAECLERVGEGPPEEGVPGHF